MKKENEFQFKLKKEIESRFPGCLVLKNDPTLIQGIPDLTVLYKDRWAFLECKRSATERHEPNQDDYIAMADKMSFGRFIFPENKKEILDELQQAFES